MTTTTKPSKAARFRQGHLAVRRTAAMLEDELARDLTHVFHQTSHAMSSQLTAASDWIRPDADELFDPAELEAEINRLLAEAKLSLDDSMAAKIGAPAGHYETRGVAHAVAQRYRNATSEALHESWQAGESVDQAAERLSLIGQSSGQLVARTSLNGMSNSTSLAGAKFAGMQVKEWITAGDDRVRPSHEEMDGEQVPLDASFSNGCQFPGDPFGPGDETWNCRCTTIYDESSEGLPDPAAEPGLDYTGYQRPSDTLTGWDDSTIGNTGEHVMDVIDQTHRAPLGMGSTLVTITEKGLGAEFRASVRETSMAVSRHAKWPNMAIAHEFGHKLDYAGSPGWFSMRKAAVMTEKVDGEWVAMGPELSEAMGGWLRAVRRSAGYKSIETDRAGYFKDVKELWARSYFQWVAQRSGDPKLLAELADARAQAPGSTFYFPQWADDDFAEISAAIDRVMRQRGLID